MNVLGGLGDIGDLRMSIGVKIPKDILTAAKTMPEFSETSNRLVGEMSAMNITLQTVVVIGVMGAIIAALLVREKGKTA